LRVSDSDRSRTVAVVEAGVIANIASCDGRWCAVTIDTQKGYIEQGKLWGVYANETVR
jgi:SH3-like domain-containing protein